MICISTGMFIPPIANMFIIWSRGTIETSSGRVSVIEMTMPVLLKNARIAGTGSLRPVIAGIFMSIRIRFGYRRAQCNGSFKIRAGTS